MEVQQAPSEHSVSTAALGVETAASARGSKMDVDETPVDAVMLQPAAPTLDVALDALPTTTAALAPDSASSQTHELPESADAGDVDFAALDSSFHAGDSEHIRDSDTMSGASRLEDVEVAPFAFGASVESDECGSDDVMHPPSPTEPTMGDTPQPPLGSSSRAEDGANDLISLPSPVASGATGGAPFDVFAMSPVKQTPRDADDDSMSSARPMLSEQTAAAKTLDPAAPALSPGKSTATDEPLTRDDAPAIQSTEHERDDQEGYESDWDADAADASEQMPDASDEGLSITAPLVASTLPSVAGDDERDAVAPSPGQQRQPASASPAASPGASAPASSLAVGSATESSDAEETVDQSSSAAADVMQSSTLSEGERPPLSFDMDSSAVEAESPVKARVAAADQPSSPPKQVAADSPVKSQLQRSPAPAAVREARPSSKDSHPLKTSKAAKTSSSAEPKDSSATSKEAKSKNGRVTNPPAAPKVKASDSAKVKAAPPALTRTTAAKSKASSSCTAPSGAPATRPGLTAKAKADAPSGSQARERGAKVGNNKSPVPAPPKREASTASGKSKASIAVPPPAPALLEQEGPKSVKKRLSSSELEAASNRLYSDALEAKKRKEVLKAELEEAFTFVPQVNAAKRHVVPDEKNRFVLLHEKAMEAAKRKEELKKKREKSECTFKPKITAKAKKLTTKSTKPRYENLYQQAHEIKQKREEKKHEIEQKAVDECSFKPKIKTMKSPTKSRPLYDAERLKQKKLALEQKKIEAELSECTFKPKVVANKAAKSKSDDAGKSAGGDAKLYDRLYQASQKRAENLEKLRLEREAQVKSVATFHPKITSSGSTKSSAAGASKQPFHERLYNKDHMQKVTADREQKKLEEVQKFSFKVSVCLRTLSALDTCARSLTHATACLHVAAPDHGRAGRDQVEAEQRVE